MTKKVQFQKRGYEVQVHEHEFIAERAERQQIHSNTPSSIQTMLEKMQVLDKEEIDKSVKPSNMDIERKLTQQSEKLESDSKIVRKLNNFRRKSVQLSMNIMQKIRRGSISGGGSSRRSSITSDKKNSISEE